MSEVYDQRVSGGADDGTTSATWWSRDSSYLWCGPGSKGFWRFTGLPMGQGVTIDSAYIYVRTHQYSGANPLFLKIKAVAEDNVAAFPAQGSTTAMWDKVLTSAGVDFDINPWVSNTVLQSADIKSVIQEIVDRPGWAASNALAICFIDDGGTYTSDFQPYEYSSADAMRLVITYTGISTRTKTCTAIAKIDNPMRDVGIKIMKPTYDVVHDNDPSHQIFNSDFGTLKYALHGYLDVQLTEAGDFAASGYIEHNLGYKPFVEVYVEDLQSPGNFYYCPGYEAGASVFWGSMYRITDTRLQLYIDTTGFEEETPTFRFHYFIFKNDLEL